MPDPKPLDQHPLNLHQPTSTVLRSKPCADAPRISITDRRRHIAHLHQHVVHLHQQLVGHHLVIPSISMKRCRRPWARPHSSFVKRAPALPRHTRHLPPVCQISLGTKLVRVTATTRKTTLQLRFATPAKGKRTLYKKWARRLSELVLSVCLTQTITIRRGPVERSQ